MKVLFVCTGNICRSPTAEGVFRKRLEERGLAQEIIVDSAGTHAYHVGETPDMRSVNAAKKRGVDIASLRARKVSSEDFYAFHYMLALDSGHLEFLQRMARKDATAKLSLFHDYDVPDPYYGKARDFEHVLDLIETASDAWINKLTSGV